MSEKRDSKGQLNPAFDSGECPEENIELQNADPESDGPKTKHPYPKSVFFIVSNEFCERFSFYGLRTILSLYLNYRLHFDMDSATVIYHIFLMMCYFFPTLGAILADSWLGKFRTIFYLSVIYVSGNILVSLAAIPNFIPPREFTMFGLLLIAMGTGGIKPCVSAFGGDQFILPEQERQLQKFFSLFYFSINAGSLISTILTPVLREDVKCFGDDSCYSLAFGIPALLMITASAVFVAGRKWYKVKEPEGNVIVEIAKCVWYAARKKTTEKREHWLCKADDKFDRKFIQDIRGTFGVLILALPLPIFWALFDQQGSRWTFQAARMDVDVGGLKIKPDQIQVVNPVLILIFIPLFDNVIYPLLGKINVLRRPLQKLTVGGLLAGAAFFTSALLETKLEVTYPELPNPGEGQLRLINTYSQDINVTIFANKEEEYAYLEPFELFQNLHIKLDAPTKISVRIENPEYIKEFETKIHEQKASTFFFLGPHKNNLVEMVHEDIDKSREGDPKLMILIADDMKNDQTISVHNNNKNFSFTFNSSMPVMDLVKLPTDPYTVTLDNNKIGKIHPRQGGLYSLIVTNERENKTNVVTITQPNSVCILWIIPQYVVLTAGEIMFSVTGIEFSFTQAPESMKSLMQAVWLFAVAIGNLIVVIVAKSKIFQSQTYEFILFGSLMTVDMIVFALLAMRYTYVEDRPQEESNELEQTKPKE